MYIHQLFPSFLFRPENNHCRRWVENHVLALVMYVALGRGICSQKSWSEIFVSMAIMEMIFQARMIAWKPADELIPGVCDIRTLLYRWTILAIRRPILTRKPHNLVWVHIYLSLPKSDREWRFGKFSISSSQACRRKFFCKRDSNSGRYSLGQFSRSNRGMYVSLSKKTRTRL